MTQPRVVGGRYELGELIGYGGMAEVHRGRDSRLGREVAIKVLRADLARDPSFLNRFRREAQAAAGLNHPSIVSVYDTGEDVSPDGTPQPFIVMEFVEGRTLRDILKSEGRLPVRRALEVAADVCGALEFSHRDGLIHRDIKPANVMITKAGAVKVMDFGIARAVADNGATVTQTANVIGTAQYLSPEQARGEAVDARSDVYSTGCLLYELITGTPPFQGDSPVAVAYQHVRENAVAPSTRVPGLPRSVDSIVMKALAKNQLNRYQSAAEMRSDLQRALADQPVTAETVMTDAERTQFIARTPPVMPLPVRDADPEADDEHSRRGLIWGAVVAALVVVCLVALGIFWLVRGSGDNPPPTFTVRTNVIGKTVTEAKTAYVGKARLVANPTNPTTSGPCDGGVSAPPENSVCTLRQDNTPVKEGSVLPVGSTITYQVYREATGGMPYVQGLQVEDAVKEIQGLGLGITPHFKHVYSDQPQGTVVNQDPSPTATVSKDSKVLLSVSVGKILLPDVKGMSSDAAKSKIYRAGFTNVTVSPTTVSTQDPAKDGTVSDENPSAKIAYTPGTKVTLTIFQYQPPVCTTTTQTPPPTTIVPTTGPPTTIVSTPPPTTSSSCSTPGGGNSATP